MDEHRLDWDSIDVLQEKAEEFVELLKRDVYRPPGNFAIASGVDKNRLEFLLEGIAIKGLPRRL